MQRQTIEKNALILILLTRVHNGVSRKQVVSVIYRSWINKWLSKCIIRSIVSELAGHYKEKYEVISWDSNHTPNVGIILILNKQL